MTKRRLVTLIVICSILTLIVLPNMTGCSSESTAAPTSVPTTAVASTTSSTTTAPTTSTTTSGKTIELRWIYWSGLQPKPGNAQWPWWNSFQSYVKNNTNGQVKFIMLDGATTNDKLYDGLVAGTGDIAYNPVPMNTGRWPLIELTAVPDLYTVCRQPAHAMVQFYGESPEIQKGFSDIHMLTVYGLPTSPPGIGFVTIDKPIKSLEDAKGVKMGAFGVWQTKLANALGFVSVATPPNQVYENLQKGVVDGSFIDVSFLSTYRVGELVQYWHGISTGFNAFWFGMNTDTWNSLSPDVQKVLTDAAAQVPDWVDYGYTEYAKAIFAKWPSVTQVELTTEEQDRWRAAQDPVQQEYLDELTKKGIDGNATFDKMNEILKSYTEPISTQPANYVNPAS